MSARCLSWVGSTVCTWTASRCRGGGKFSYSYLERGGGVIIVPVLTDGRVVLIRQYRYAVDARCIELPAGCAFDAGELSLEALCRKELREEIGATAERVEPMGWFYSSSSLSDEVCHVFLATGCVLAGDAEPEPGESIERLVVPVAEALRLARERGDQDGDLRVGAVAVRGAVAGALAGGGRPGAEKFAETVRPVPPCPCAARRRR